jgi:hypothetical protein
MNRMLFDDAAAVVKNNAAAVAGNAAVSRSEADRLSETLIGLEP